MPVDVALGKGERSPCSCLSTVKLSVSLGFQLPCCCTQWNVIWCTVAICCLDHLYYTDENLHFKKNPTKSSLVWCCERTFQRLVLHVKV